MKNYSKINFQSFQMGEAFNVDLTSVKTHFYLLIGVFALFTIGIALPLTRELTLLVLAENYLVENLSFIAFLVGGGIGLKFSFDLLKSKSSTYFATAFYFGLSVLLIAIGMEEISWGQQFLGFETPESFREMNEQGETTIHNIKGMSGNSEYLRMFYGICGLIGVSLMRNKTFRKLAAPVFLFPWFALIIAHATVDIFNDIVPIQKHFDAFISELAELVEMLIAFSALIYIGYKANTYFDRSNSLAAKG